MAKPVLAINARTLANSGCNVAVIPSQLILGPASHLRHRNAKASKWQRMLQWFFGTHLRPLVRHKGPQKIWRAQFTCTPAVHSVSADGNRLAQTYTMPVDARWPLDAIGISCRRRHISFELQRVNRHPRIQQPEVSETCNGSCTWLAFMAPIRR